MAGQQRPQAMNTQQNSKDQTEKKSEAAGISHRSPAEEQHEQEE